MAHMAPTVDVVWPNHVQAHRAWEPEVVFGKDSECCVLTGTPRTTSGFPTPSLRAAGRCTRVRWSTPPRLSQGFAKQRAQPRVAKPSCPVLPQSPCRSLSRCGSECVPSRSKLPAVLLVRSTQMRVWGNRRHRLFRDLRQCVKGSGERRCWQRVFHTQMVDEVCLGALNSLSVVASA